MTSRPEPFYFGPPERPLFGLLHRPDAPSARARRVGLVVCTPFGYEAICAPRALRHLAIGAAAASLPTLRFDYDGTGDSAGSDWDPARLGAWIRSVHHAIDALREETGVTDVALVGLRLGALVASLAALERTDVAGVAAIAPVASGRAYLRELKALQLALHLEPPPPDAAKREGVEEAIGFVLTAETRAELGAVDLHKLAHRPAGAMLLLDRDDFPPNEKLAAHLVSLGARVDRQRLPGYADMMLDPHKTKVPAGLVAVTVAWAEALAEGLPPAAERQTESSSREDDAHGAARRTRARMPRGESGAVEERALWLDDGGASLFGILTLPARPAEGALDPAEPAANLPPKAVLWLNSGSVPHIGPNRMVVELARRWASQGHAVLRIDVSGIGESAPRPGEADNVVYSERARDDTAAALGYLKSRGVRECHAIGLCSGAYNAFKGAVAGQPLDGIVLVNPAVFFWKPGMSLDFEFRAARVNREATRYRRGALDARKWLKLLRGQVELRPAVQILSRRAAAIATTSLRDVARRMGHPLSEDLAAELETIARRRIPMFFVFAAGEPGIDLLETEGGATAQRLRHKNMLKLALLQGPDHTFTPLWAQDKLGAILDDHFFGR
jgi:pimeloyl-ACP methyl ester carboxylesterase